MDWQSDYNPYGIDRDRFETYEDFADRRNEEMKAHEDELYRRRYQEQAMFFDLLKED